MDGENGIAYLYQVMTLLVIHCVDCTAHSEQSACSKPCYLLLEDAENVKESATRKSELRQLIIDVLSICVKKYDTSSGTFKSSY